MMNNTQNDYKVTSETQPLMSARSFRMHEEYASAKMLNELIENFYLQMAQKLVHPFNRPAKDKIKKSA